MKDFLLFGVKRFLESRVNGVGPLLLGYSGGPDSKALLYLLLKCRRFFPLDLHLAHIDHGWRAESAWEADQIQKEAEALKLPLHLHRLSKEVFEPGNLEEQGRLYRLQFFSQIYKLIGSQALLLGHHADDQSEVVLKRVFEGASIFSLGGLSLESSIYEMTLWRPLLFVTKTTVLEWMLQENLKGFQDLSNFSSEFLRGRMRQEMIPALSRMFGKGISSNLCRLAEESLEIKEYFSKINQEILAQIQGDVLDLNSFSPLPSLQLKYLLKEWMRGKGITLSRQILDGITLALQKNGSLKKFSTKQYHFHVEKRCLYCITISS